MATSNNQSHSVFIGNIPYHASEEEVQQLCEEIGPIVSFKLVTEKETGKRKGFGFCEYRDEETALSARRNLNGCELRGRTLRVNFVDKGKNNDKNQQEGSRVENNVDPLTLFMAKYPRIELIQIVSEWKEFAANNIEQAGQLLMMCPNLGKALFQAQLKLGIVHQHMLEIPKINVGPEFFTQHGIQNQSHLGKRTTNSRVDDDSLGSINQQPSKRVRLNEEQNPQLMEQLLQLQQMFVRAT